MEEEKRNRTGKKKKTPLATTWKLCSSTGKNRVQTGCKGNLQPALDWGHVYWHRSWSAFSSSWLPASYATCSVWMFDSSIICSAHSILFGSFATDDGNETILCMSSWLPLAFLGCFFLSSCFFSEERRGCIALHCQGLYSLQQWEEMKDSSFGSFDQNKDLM